MSKLIKLFIVGAICAFAAYVIHSFLTTAKIDENTVD